MVPEREKREALEKLIIDNQDLNELESRLSEFNIFEAVGMVRQEVKHSNFLASLLNPVENHRSGELFLKRLLIRILQNLEDPPFSAIEIDIADLKDVEIRREWSNIDLLIHSPTSNLLCVIENKLDSAEHSNQLARYKRIINLEFPACRKLFLYLTKKGTPTSQGRWFPLGYGDIADVVDTICNNYQSTMSDEICALMKYYVNLIRRHTLSDSDICQVK